MIPRPSSFIFLRQALWTYISLQNIKKKWKKKINKRKLENKKKEQSRKTKVPNKRTFFPTPNNNDSILSRFLIPWKQRKLEKKKNILPQSFEEKKESMNSCRSRASIFCKFSSKEARYKNGRDESQKKKL